MFTDWPFSLATRRAAAREARPPVTAASSRRQRAGLPYPSGRLPLSLVQEALTSMLERDETVDFLHPSAAAEVAFRQRMEAIEGLARLHHGSDAIVIHRLITIVEDPQDDPRLGMLAGIALWQMADAALQALLLERIIDVNAPERVRSAYLGGLWRYPNAELSTRLLPLLRGETNPGAIKLLAALAIGYAANPANDNELLRLLDDRHARRFAAIAVVLGGDDACARRVLEVLPTDRYAEEVVRTTIEGARDDRCNRVCASLFGSGQIYRRMRVAEILKDGHPGTGVSYGYAWQRLAGLLAAGSEAAGAMSRRAIRAELYKALIGQDPERRRLVAKLLVDMPARGLLLAARDAGVREAIEALRSMDEAEARERATWTATPSAALPRQRKHHHTRETRR